MLDSRTSADYCKCNSVITVQQLATQLSTAAVTDGVRNSISGRAAVRQKNMALLYQLIFSNIKILNRSTNSFLLAHWVTVSLTVPKPAGALSFRGEGHGPLGYGPAGLWLRWGVRRVCRWPRWD